MPIKVYCDICDKHRECCKYDSIWSCDERDEKYPHPDMKDNMLIVKKENQLDTV